MKHGMTAHKEREHTDHIRLTCILKRRSIFDLAIKIFICSEGSTSFETPRMNAPMSGGIAVAASTWRRVGHAVVVGPKSLTFEGFSHVF